MSKTATCGTSGHALDTASIPSSAGGLCKGASALNCLDRGDHVIVDHDGIGELLAPVHDPMPDARRPRILRQSLGGFENRLDRRLVVAWLAVPSSVDSAVVVRAVQFGLARAQTFGDAGHPAIAGLPGSTSTNLSDELPALRTSTLPRRAASVMRTIQGQGQPRDGNAISCLGGPTTGRSSSEMGVESASSGYDFHHLEVSRSRTGRQSTMADTPTTETRGEPELKRVMGPKLLLLFIVGDILGTGVYALTGEVAGEVGGAAWAPFLAAFIVATITAFSYLELVTKYPQAAGAALYTHKAFGIHFFTFLVAFTVMCSGITSASTASAAFASNLVAGFELSWGTTGVMLTALAFMAVVAAINFRGVGESVKANVVLTLVEVSGLLLVILIGFYAMTEGKADFGPVFEFDTAGDKNAFLAVTAATSLAFFAMVGFEDSVNMAEETKDPSRIFPKIMLTGLGITGTDLHLVSIAAVALVPVAELEDPSVPPLLRVVEAGAPGLPMEHIYPFITMFAVANSALINMLMASRLLYGMAHQRVLPASSARCTRDVGRRGCRSSSPP